SSEAPVFRSRKKGHLDESAIWRIVKKASERAGIDKDVSCHWFRHAHASHALDRGCPIHLVQATLGHASISTTGRYLHARPTDSSGNYLPF
ncbi:tyrosine-type recombinase/integrase, partial [bacterium]|nr:tyrosine-type recombinase/integrase [bacterium]